MSKYKQEFQRSDLMLGDIHGSLGFFNHLKNNKERHIIQVGDFGLFINNSGFLNDLQKSLEKRKLTLHAIRGNHDNPEFWKNTKWTEKYDRINLIQDYQHVMIENKSFLCVGGGISVDRSLRKEGVSYWRDEAVNYQRINKEHYGLICHSAPSYFNLDTPKSWGYYNKDTKLKHDLEDERLTIDQIVKDIDCKWVIGGHFHNNAREYRWANGNQIRYRCLNINESVEIGNLWT